MIIQLLSNNNNNNNIVHNFDSAYNLLDNVINNNQYWKWSLKIILDFRITLDSSVYVGKYTSRYKCSHKLMSCVRTSWGFCVVIWAGETGLCWCKQPRPDDQDNLNTLRGLVSVHVHPCGITVPQCLSLWMCVCGSAAALMECFLGQVTVTVQIWACVSLKAAPSQRNHYKYAPKIHS